MDCVISMNIPIFCHTMQKHTFFSVCDAFCCCLSISAIVTSEQKSCNIAKLSLNVQTAIALRPGCRRHTTKNLQMTIYPHVMVIISSCIVQHFNKSERKVAKHCDYSFISDHLRLSKRETLQKTLFYVFNYCIST